MAALFVSSVCTIAAAAVLVRSNGQPLDDWKLQPSVILSIASAVFKLALGSAMAQGAIIFWWNRAVKGSTMKDLQRVFEQSQDLKGAFFAGKHVTLVAIATVVCTLCAAAGPLLQRASSVVVATTTSSVNITGHVASELPQDYSAFITPGSNNAIGGATLAFASVLKDYEQNLPITSDLTGCKGNCSAIINAAGMTPVCGAPIVTDWGINRTNIGGIPIFQVSSFWADNGVKVDRLSLEQITLEVCINFCFHPPLFSLLALGSSAPI